MPDTDDGGSAAKAEREAARRRASDQSDTLLGVVLSDLSGKTRLIGAPGLGSLHLFMDWFDFPIAVGRLGVACFPSRPSRPAPCSQGPVTGGIT